MRGAPRFPNERCLAGLLKRVPHRFCQAKRQIARLQLSNQCQLPFMLSVENYYEIDFKQVTISHKSYPKRVEALKS